MSWFRSLRWPLLCALLLGSSAWVPVPLPARLFDPVLAQVELDGHPLHWKTQGIHLLWGQGLLRIDGLVLSVGEEEWLRTRHAALSVDLRPWSAHRYTLRRLSVDGGSLRLDRNRIEALIATQRGRPSTAPSPLDIRLQDVAITLASPWPGGEPLPLRVSSAAGVIGHEGVRVHASIATGGRLEAECWARVGADPSDWGVDLVCSGRDLRARTPLPFAFAAAACRLRVHLSPGEWVTRADFQDSSLDFQRPSLHLSLASLTLDGKLSQGIRIQARGQALEEDFEGQAWLRRETVGSPLRLRAELELPRVEVNPRTIAALATLEDSAATALAALELRGGAPVRAALDWTWGEEPRWAAATAFEDLSLTYRGFLEEDGQQPSFPYPARKLQGICAAGGDCILVDTRGSMGEGRVRGRGMVRIGHGPAGLAFDVDLDGIPVDERVTHALGGTPSAAAAWREFGGPHGGVADASLLIRRPLGRRKVALSLDTRIRGTHCRPAFAPFEAIAEDFRFHWAPGGARFQGQVSALGGRFEVGGRVMAVRGADRPQLAFHAENRSGIAPTAAERKILERYLRLPAGISNFSLSGPSHLKLELRRAAGEEADQTVVRWEGEGAQLRWEPSGTRWTDLHGRVSLVRARKSSGIYAPWILSHTSGGSLSGSISLDPTDPEGSRLVVHGEGIHPDDEARAFARALAGMEGERRPLAWSGMVDFRLALAPLDPRRNSGTLSLHPLTVRLAGIPGQVAQAVARGDLEVRDSRLVDGKLAVALGEGGRLRLRELHGEGRPEGGWFLGATISSAAGVRIMPLISLLSPKALAALEQVGFAGEAGAEDLVVKADFGPDSSELELAGTLLADRVRVSAPPRMDHGRARLEIESFHWRNPQDFHGLLRLVDGSGRVAGFQVHDTTARIRIDPEQVRFQRLDAHTLGGVVRTFGPEPGERASDAPGVDGELQLGLRPNAPIRFLLFLENLDLAKVREELRLGGSLAGRLRGRLEFQSTSPHLIDYSGTGWIEVEHGALGTVPVLADMWRAAHRTPPVFDSGRVEFLADAVGARGRLRIESFRFQHPLFEVQGKGWVDLDSYLDLKATVRTLSFLTRLPLVRDLVDLLVEQNVQGPIEHPRVSQRALDKTLRGEGERIPFPLWGPSLETTDWRRSPAFPPVREPTKD